METIKTTINFLPESSAPVYSDTSSQVSNSVLPQTGNCLIFFVVALILLLVIGLCGFMYFKNIKNKQNCAVHCNTLELFKYQYKYIFVILLTICVFGVSLFGFLNLVFADNSSSKISTPDVINAYINQDTGSVSFDLLPITNISDNDIIYDTISVIKPEGIDDGGCTWTISVLDKCLYSGQATGIPSLLVDKFSIETGKTLNIKINTTMNPATAISLIGKSVLCLSFDINDGYKISWDEDTSNVLSVKDKNDIAVENNSCVDANSNITVLPDSSKISTLRYTLNTKLEDGTEEFYIYEIGQNSSFTMPEGNVEIWIEEEFTQFYAVVDSAYGLKFFYDKDYIEKSESGDYIACYPEAEFDFDAHSDSSPHFFWPWHKDDMHENITAIDFDLSIKDFNKFKSTFRMFYDFWSAETINNLDYLNFFNITDTSYMFYNYGYSVAEAKLPDFTSCDLSNVENMQGMFCGCFSDIENCDCVPNLKGCNLNKVKDMSYMFKDYAFCSLVFNQPIDFSNCGLENVENMSYMFNKFAYNSSSLNCVPNFSGCSLSKVEDMSGMFYEYGECSLALRCFPDFSACNLSSLVNVTNMFHYYAWNVTSDCTTADLSYLDTSKINSCDNMLSKIGIDKLIIGKNWYLHLSDTGFGKDYWTISSPLKAPVYVTDPVDGRGIVDNYLWNADGSWKWDSWPITITSKVS